MIFEPGTGWVYGCGIDWAGRVVEILSKQSLESFMQTHIFSPLQMNFTTFHPEHVPSSTSRQQTLGFRGHSTGELTPGNNPWAYPAKDCCGGVGLYSTRMTMPNFWLRFLTLTLSFFRRSRLRRCLQGSWRTRKFLLKLYTAKAGLI